MFGVDPDLHDLTYRRDVPELGVDARLVGRLSEDGLEFWFPACPARTEHILVGRHSAISSAMMPTSTPLGGVQDRLCFHPHQHIIVRMLLPSDQDGGFFRGDLSLLVPITSETAQNHKNIVCFLTVVMSWGRRYEPGWRRMNSSSA